MPNTLTIHAGETARQYTRTQRDVDKLIDVSPDFVANRYDAMILDKKILPYAETPKAIRRFNTEQHGLSDYGYWFTLGTLWVSYTGWSDLDLWKRLFRSTRPNRDTSLMKPSELQVFRELPDPITAYRAHRTGETDWISYTLSAVKAGVFARQRGVTEIVEYRIAKTQALCLFLRRHEFEVLSLEHAERVRVIPVVMAGGGS